METSTRARLEWTNKTTSRDDSDEFVWFLREMENPVYGSPRDTDKVYLRVDAGGVQSIVVKTNNSDEKKNNSISFTTLEIDMLSIFLSEKYTHSFTMLTSRTIHNGRRKVLVDILSEGEDRMRFTLVRYTNKSRAWVVRNSVTLTVPKVKTFMKIYNLKIRDKLMSYDDGPQQPMVADNDELDVDGDSDDDDDGSYTAKPSKSRRVEASGESTAMDSSMAPGIVNGSEEHLT
jgi:hypothetical protein